MPVKTTYPGVYVQEIPSGTHTIVGVATSVTAFVGYLRRGPINRAVQLLNFGDFQRVFGGLDDQSVTSFQVSQFFLNGGTEAWVTRVLDETQRPLAPAVDVACGPQGGGTGSKPGSAPPVGTAVLTAEAANQGTWGQDVFIMVDYLTPPGSALFNLYATLYNFTSGAVAPVRTMALPGVSMDASQPNYILDVLQGISSTDTNLIKFDGQPPAASPPPFPSGTILAFVPQDKPLPSVTLSVSVTAPGPDGKSKTSKPFDVAVGPVQGLDSFVAAVQAALAVAGPQLGVPALSSATVRSFTWPFPLPPPPHQGSPAPEPGYVQVVLTDPTQHDTLVGITAKPATGFTLVQTNYQALRLKMPTGAPKKPDGAIPRGIDIAGNATNRTGIYALEALSIVNILCAPDLRDLSTPGQLSPDYLTGATALLNYALLRRAFAILDLPSDVKTVPLAAAWASANPAKFGRGIISAAAYYPEPQIPDPFGTQLRSLGASGTMAGLYAATDLARGVWKAPAGITAALAGVQQLAYTMTDQENGILNPMGMNALRTFPVYGGVSWGARTLASPNPASDDWKYINVRRLALYIEQSLIRGLQWVVFEPNDETLWAQIRLTVNGFLHPLFQQGAFAGSTPSQAYRVVCDASTTTFEDMDNGVVNVLILFAPAKPAEFVVISIQQMAGQSSS
jgi:uncharacterized protein